MQLELDNGLDKPDEVRCADIIFKELDGFLIFTESCLASWTVFLFYELLELLCLVRENLSTVVFKYALQFSLQHGCDLL